MLQWVPMRLAHWSAQDLRAFGDDVSLQVKSGLSLLLSDWDLTKRKGGHDWYGVVVGNVCLGASDAKLEVTLCQKNSPHCCICYE